MKKLMILMMLIVSGCASHQKQIIKGSAQIGCLKACHLFMDGPKLTDERWALAVAYCESIGDELATTVTE